MTFGTLLAVIAFAWLAKRMAEELLVRLGCIFVLLQAGLPLRRRTL